MNVKERHCSHSSWTVSKARPLAHSATVELFLCVNWVVFQTRVLSAFLRILGGSVVSVVGFAWEQGVEDSEEHAATLVSKHKAIVTH